MKGRQPKDARAWLAQHGESLPPEELPNETGARAGELGGDKDHVTRDGVALAFAAEMADHARDILEHPSFTPQERCIWEAHVLGLRDEPAIAHVRAAGFGCSKTTVKRAMDKGKALMLRPGEPLARAKAGAPTDPVTEAFKDLERTIELGAYNAHRVITDIHTRSGMATEDVDNNERAVRTVLAIRKSELEYLRMQRPQPGDEGEVRRIAGQERV